MVIAKARKTCQAWPGGAAGLDRALSRIWYLAADGLVKVGLDCGVLAPFQVSLIFLLGSVS